MNIADVICSVLSPGCDPDDGVFARVTAHVPAYPVAY
jgi:hypothetical protein